MQSRAREVLLPAGLVLLGIAFFFLVMVPPTLHDTGPESILKSYDFHSYFLPRFILGAEELRLGQWPLWNPFEYAGLPLLATAQPAALYPPKVLFFSLLRPQSAYWAFLIFHYLVSAFGFIWFTREQRLSPAAIVVGSLSWVFSEGTLASNYHLNRVANFCWIPYCFLFAYRLLEAPRLKDFALLALVVGLQLTAGYPEWALDTALMIGVMLILRPLTARPIRVQWYRSALVIGAVALGAIVASVQTLPLAEIALEAKRSSMADLAKSSIGNWYRLDRLFWPPALMVLMVLSLSRRSGWVASGVTLFCLFIVAGGWSVLRKIPGLSFIRFPFGWALVSQFPFAWAAATGAEIVLLSRAGTNRNTRSVLLLTILGGALSAAYCVWRALEIPNSIGVPEVVATHTSAALGILGSVLLVALAVRLLGDRPGAKLLVAAAVALTASLLVSYPFGYPNAAVRRPSKHGQIARLLGDPGRLQGRAFSAYDVLYGYNLTDRMPSIFGIEDSFLPWRYREIVMKVGFHAVGALDWNALVTARGLLDALNLQYVASEVRESQFLVPKGFRPIRLMGSEVLWENPTRMGTAWVNYAVRVMGEDAVRDYVLGPRFDPHAEVVLEREPSAKYPEVSAERATPIHDERRTSASELEIGVELPRAGVLVVSESAYPGWRAEVDGRPAEWVRADYVLRGLELGPGRHRVRFFYRPLAFRLGLGLSGIGILTVVVLFVLGVKRQNRQIVS